MQLSSNTFRATRDTSSMQVLIMINDSLATGRGESRYGIVTWGVICFLISITGFWPSYVAPLVTGAYHTPSSIMPWHVLSTTLWLVLLISQPWLILLDRVSLHRRFGLLGLVIAAGVVLTGLALQIDVMGPHAAKGDTTNAVVIPFIRFSLLLGFAVCVGWAFALRQRRDWHMRLMLLGTFPLLQSSFDRLAANVLGLIEIRGLIALLGHLALMMAFVIWDRRQQGYVHPVTKWGTILLTAFYLGSPLFAGTEWWREIAANLAKA